jgi:hypothetical protein
MLPANVKRTVAVPSRGSVKVLIQRGERFVPCDDDVGGFPSLSEDLEEHLGAVSIELQLPSSSMQSRFTRP